VAVGYSQRSRTAKRMLGVRVTEVRQECMRGCPWEIREARHPSKGAGEKERGEEEGKRSKRKGGSEWYGIVEFNVPLDTV